MADFIGYDRTWAFTQSVLYASLITCFSQLIFVLYQITLIGFNCPFRSEKEGMWLPMNDHCVKRSNAKKLNSSLPLPTHQHQENNGKDKRGFF